MKYINSKSTEEMAVFTGSYTPNLININTQRQASVALVLGESKMGPEIFFIQRATSEQDPWSGQIAFPGGGKEDHDLSIMDTAIRETSEETGIVLSPEMNIGRLNDYQGRSSGRSLNLVVSCFVFSINTEPIVIPNYEVAEAFWIPLSLLLDSDKSFEYQTTYSNEPYPAIDLGVGESGQERVLWGLTYRFVRNFLTIIEEKLKFH